KMSDKLTRIAIVSSDRCKPKKCRQECKRSCPVVRVGKLCIEVTPADKTAFISEELCIGCGICVKKCPFEAINIINLPSNLEKDTTHRYGPNSFKLHRLASGRWYSWLKLHQVGLPLTSSVQRPGEVLGLVGTNGIGKSTANRPNGWRFFNFRGSEQNFFTKILEDNLKAVVKPQYVDQIPKAVKGTVQGLMDKKDDRGVQESVCEQFDLLHVRDREVEMLSGGELQRFACAMVCIQKADVYMFDEPSSYLDVKQRLNAARAIRALLTDSNYVVAVEHDLSVLDYLSDFICCLYGVPGAYGVVTLPSGVREGINIFLDGFIPTENLRFRDTALVFKVAETAMEEETKRQTRYSYPEMTKRLGDSFSLKVESGTFADSQIVVMLGENGTGKTTFIRLLGGRLEPDGGCEMPALRVSYKPQKISPKSDKTVQNLFLQKIRDAVTHPQFQTDLERLYDQEVQNLSGGELQRVALAICLGTPADVYLIDEPSAYLDSEQRLHAARVIKRYILHAKKAAFVVVFDGSPGVDTRANSPETLLAGMNRFLRLLGITFRRDPNNFRPRINKLNSVKDAEQKKTGNFFFLED
uniref:Rnase l inhibitor abc superfamily protein n=1 Tax=Macrostomum lignano TaxID=282301 RepID=A0A1I8HJ93_9PLAT